MATYYISTTGNNSTGDGSFGNPWESLSYATGRVSAGDDDCYIYNNYFKNSRMGIQYNNAQIRSDNGN